MPPHCPMCWAWPLGVLCPQSKAGALRWPRETCVLPRGPVCFRGAWFTGIALILSFTQTLRPITVTSKKRCPREDGSRLPVSLLSSEPRPLPVLQGPGQSALLWVARSGPVSSSPAGEPRPRHCPSPVLGHRRHLPTGLTSRFLFPAAVIPLVTAPPQPRVCTPTPLSSGSFCLSTLLCKACFLF